MSEPFLEIGDALFGRSGGGKRPIEHRRLVLRCRWLGRRWRGREETGDPLLVGAPAILSG
jgi:hypothetical protein